VLSVAWEQLRGIDTLEFLEAIESPLMLLLRQTIDSAEVFLRVTEDPLLVRELELEEQANENSAPFLHGQEGARLEEDWFHDI